MALEALTLHFISKALFSNALNILNDYIMKKFPPIVTSIMQKKAQTSDKRVFGLGKSEKIFFCLVNICHNNVAFDQSLRRVNNVDLLVNLGLNALFNRLLFAWH